MAGEQEARGALPAPGERLFFGRYPQRGPEAEPVEWLALERREGCLLLISCLGLSARPWDDSGDWTVNWARCSLRAWLNGDFFRAAFTEAEQARLQALRLEAEWNQEADTLDRVFVLSDEEAERCFPDNAARKARPTARALREGACLGEKDGPGQGSCRWWLRSPGFSMPGFVRSVNEDGSFDEEGFPMQAEHLTVRPVIALRL